MPNWCSNRVEITGPEDDAAQLRTLMTTADCNFDFNAIIPMPQEYDDTSVSNEERQLKYGHPDWYEWSCENWGSKWNSDRAEWLSTANSAEPELVQVAYFDTAWDPPFPVIFALSERFPALILRLSYFEPDMGFGGFVTVKAGEVLADHEYECTLQEASDDDSDSAS